jgi:hypothetical protein
MTEVVLFVATSILFLVADAIMLRGVIRPRLTPRGQSPAASAAAARNAATISGFSASHALKAR